MSDEAELWMLQTCRKDMRDLRNEVIHLRGDLRRGRQKALAEVATSASLGRSTIAMQDLHSKRFGTRRDSATDIPHPENSESTSGELNAFDIRIAMHFNEGVSSSLSPTM